MVVSVLEFNKMDYKDDDDKGFMGFWEIFFFCFKIFEILDLEIFDSFSFDVDSFLEE